MLCGFGISNHLSTNAHWGIVLSSNFVLLDCVRFLVMRQFSFQDIFFVFVLMQPLHSSVKLRLGVNGRSKAGIHDLIDLYNKIT